MTTVITLRLTRMLTSDYTMWYQSVTSSIPVWLEKIATLNYEENMDNIQVVYLGRNLSFLNIMKCSPLYPKLLNLGGTTQIQHKNIVIIHKIHVSILSDSFVCSSLMMFRNVVFAKILSHHTSSDPTIMNSKERFTNELKSYLSSAAKSSDNLDATGPLRVSITPILCSPHHTALSIFFINVGWISLSIHLIAKCWILSSPFQF